MDFSTLLGMLFGGGGGANAALGGVGGGGAIPPVSPAFGGSPISDVAATAALPASVGPAPQDQGPMMGGPGGDMTQLRGALGVGQPGTPMMTPSPAPSYQGVGGLPAAQPPATLGEALQPAGSGPPGYTPQGPELPGSGGYYGGSPATNPLLKPTGTAAPGGQQQRGPQDIAKMLGGIKMPQGPDVVKPSTPAAPQRQAVASSELMNLLTALFGGHARSGRMPTTLGQSLEGRPAAWGGLYG